MNANEYYLILGLVLGIPCLAFLAWIKYHDRKEREQKKH